MQRGGRWAAHVGTPCYTQCSDRLGTGTGRGRQGLWSESNR